MAPHLALISNGGHRGEFGIQPAALQFERTEPFGDAIVIQRHQLLDQAAKHEPIIPNTCSIDNPVQNFSRSRDD